MELFSADHIVKAIRVDSRRIDDNLRLICPAAGCHKIAALFLLNLFDLRVQFKQDTVDRRVLRQRDCQPERTDNPSRRRIERRNRRI